MGPDSLGKRWEKWEERVRVGLSLERFLGCPRRESWVVLIRTLVFSPEGLILSSRCSPCKWPGQVYHPMLLAPCQGQGFCLSSWGQKGRKKPHAPGVCSLDMICKVSPTWAIPRQFPRIIRNSSTVREISFQSQASKLFLFALQWICHWQGLKLRS